MDERKNGRGNGNLVPTGPIAPHEGKVTHRYGRPNKLTPERQERILECLRKGYSMQATAALSGVGKTTIYDWLRKAREGDEMYAVFLEAMEHAAATFESEAVDAIVGAGKDGKWQAYAWMIERKHPERYGRHTTTRHEGHEGGAIEFSLNMNVGKEPIQRIVEIDAGDSDTD